MLKAHLATVARLGKSRVNRDAVDSDFTGRDAELFKMRAGFVHRDKVLFVVMTQPHRMRVEVCDDDSLPGCKPRFGFEPRDDFRREKMRADGDVGLFVAEQLHERSRVEFIESQT